MGATREVARVSKPPGLPPASLLSLSAFFFLRHAAARLIIACSSRSKTIRGNSLCPIASSALHWSKSITSNTSFVVFRSRSWRPMKKL